MEKKEFGAGILLVHAIQSMSAPHFRKNFTIESAWKRYISIAHGGNEPPSGGFQHEKTYYAAAIQILAALKRGDSDLATLDKECDDWLVKHTDPRIAISAPKN